MAESSEQLHGVTIVVACYNHERFVETCLRSVYAQTLAPSLVIITDDGSTDQTQAKVREVLASHNWQATMVFHDTNRGICSTFNEALALVRTQYVAFISADDWMDPRRVEEHAGVLDRMPSSCLVYGNVHLAAHDGSATGKTYDALFDDRWPGGDHTDLFARLIEGNWIPAPSVMSRSEALRQMGGFDETFSYEDYPMWLKLASTGHEFAYLPDPLVYYRQHVDQLSRSQNWKSEIALANLELYSKYLGLSVRTDDWLRPRFGSWANTVYRHSSQPRRIAPILRRAARVSGSPKTFAASCLATLGISGPVLAARWELVSGSLPRLR